VFCNDNDLVVVAGGDVDTAVLAVLGLLEQKAEVELGRDEDVVARLVSVSAVGARAPRVDFAIRCGGQGVVIPADNLLEILGCRNSDRSPMDVVVLTGTGATPTLARCATRVQFARARKARMWSTPAATRVMWRPLKYATCCLFIEELVGKSCTNETIKGKAANNVPA